MRTTSFSATAGSRARRLPRLIAGAAAAAVVGVVPAALAAAPAGAATGSAPAGAQTGSAHAAATPTAPPPVTILIPGASRRDGDIFISPFGDSGTYANGPEILSPQGKPIWFKPVPAGQEA